MSANLYTATMCAKDWITEDPALNDSLVPVCVINLATNSGRSLCPGPLAVGVVTVLDGWIVNPYGPHTILGPELLPLGPAGMGMECGSAHPVGTPRWVQEAKPRLLAAVREAVALVLAHAAGRVCHDPHPAPVKPEYGWRCQRERGHETREGWRGQHAMSASHLWEPGASALLARS
jgi:hypothetical protein